jgi:hypothetical protein
MELGHGDVATTTTLSEERRAAWRGAPDPHEWRRREADVRALWAGLVAVHDARVVHPSGELPAPIAALLQVAASCLSWRAEARPANAREVCDLLGPRCPDA